MDEVLTIEQIEAQFPSEWVLIGEPRTDERQHLIEGKVLFHAEVDRKLLELRPSRFALRYFGMMPENSAIVL